MERSKNPKHAEFVTINKNYVKARRDAFKEIAQMDETAADYKEKKAAKITEMKQAAKARLTAVRELRKRK